MERCPKCGMDVSPALRVCGACQAALDPAPVAPSPSASGAKITKIGIAFLLLWPVLSLALGLSSLTILIGWALAVIVFGGLGGLGGRGLATGATPKTITAPVFGEITAPKWEAGTSSLWYGEVRTTLREDPIEVLVFARDDGPNERQTALLSSLLKDLPARHAAAVAALGKLDRSGWPPEAQSASPVVEAIELDDDEQELTERAFTLRFEAEGDPDGTYYVDFRHDEVEEAYRV